MRYTDSRGRPQRLTPEQANYLLTARRGFTRGWGGMSSTRTVRLLDERGLIQLWELTDPWQVRGITPLGETVLTAWQERATRT